MSDFEKQREINRIKGFNRHNGIRILEYGEDWCVVEAELRDESMNPWEMAHGGFVYSLCDVAAGVASGGILRRVVTLSSSMYFMRPSTGTKLRAEGRIIKKGKTVIVAEASVFDDNNKETARGNFEYYVVE